MAEKNIWNVMVRTQDRSQFNEQEQLKLHDRLIAIANEQQRCVQGCIIIIIIISYERQSNIIVKNFKVATAEGCRNCVETRVYVTKVRRTSAARTVEHSLAAR